MTRDTIEFDVDDRGVATITVDRPEQLNALTAETLEAIEDALDEAADRDARVLVIAGAGDEAFVAGADISHMVDLSTPEAQAYAELGHRVADAIETFPAPTVAAVDGYAFGGGCELALACDMRVAAESAVLGQTEIDLGIIPGWGGTQRLPALVGDEVARRLIFLGERIDAEEAAEVGFVGEVVADAEFDDRIDELAGELAAKPATALRAAKEALNAAGEGSAATGLALERRAWAGLFGTHDQREGMEAFLAKREPEFE
ncbi:enoyl-CoA hydratase [Halorubrum distributum JCM 9100]|uniref:Enoyl-CoA hydratase n=3 Tax=Halorubrum distributum TaxID=29283 RepID=M0EVN8_9EURY|nr:MULTISPECIES: enoyl-CoA hydratase-related protein [Halorubrum distributum group]ELZ51128.1 enoyl-CoA hydratase [Halorubrum distributum JCM 9100]ELZ53077.1 enoyl-CoA hydratase [Halorubrum distributum JCM 10118]MYL15350.1 enoyl-CoA hydratase/isomerase family protein [Halorubrum terrestre]